MAFAIVIPRQTEISGTFNQLRGRQFQPFSRQILYLCRVRTGVQIAPVGVGFPIVVASAQHPGPFTVLRHYVVVDEGRFLWDVVRGLPIRRVLKVRGERSQSAKGAKNHRVRVIPCDARVEIEVIYVGREIFVNTIPRIQEPRL